MKCRILLTFLCPTNKGVRAANRTALENLNPDLKGKIFTVLTEDTPAQKEARAALKKRFDEPVSGTNYAFIVRRSRHAG